MGIKDLWSILQPYCERKPLYELTGKVVAIDLAGWVCESLCVINYEVQQNFHLRNLYFRTCYLLLSGVTPVFVLEGDAPSLKYDVISKRNELQQFKGAKPKKNPLTKNPITNNKGRTQFNYVLKQCEELLRSLGLECVKGLGEAEAYCAYLNKHQYVDGIISQDSDCFGYGAQIVYRNFSVSTQGNQSAQGGSIDVYDLNRIANSLDFGQHKIIAMAILCGCDYCPGVEGIGKDTVMKLFDIYKENEILEILKLWRINTHKYNVMESKVNDKLTCTNCGHTGKLQRHTKSGCFDCNQKPGCNSTLWKDQRLAMKTELQIRQKALLDPQFPSQNIIDEFLNEPNNTIEFSFNWKEPNIIKFVKFMGKLLQWNEIYCFQKMLPLLSRWQLYHICKNLRENKTDSNLQHNLKLLPKYIKKKRAPKGVDSYEIIWEDSQRCFTGLIPDEQMELFLNDEKNKLETLWSTIEPIELVTLAYPELVKTYVDSKLKKKTTKKKRNPTLTNSKGKIPVKKIRKTTISKKDPDASLNDMSCLLNELENIENNNEIKKPIKKLNNKKSKKDVKMGVSSGQQKLMDNFFIKNKLKNPQNFSSTPLNLTRFLLQDDSILDDDCSIIDNDVLKDIINKTPELNEYKGRKLRFETVNFNDRIIDSPKISDSLDVYASTKIETSIIHTNIDSFDLLVGKYNKNMYKLDNIKSPMSTNLSNKIYYSTPTSSKLQIDKISELDDDLNKIHERTIDNVNNRSYFFANVQYEDVDYFEQSINYRNLPSESESDTSDSS